jgi:hypothetical protein
MKSLSDTFPTIDISTVNGGATAVPAASKPPTPAGARAVSPAQAQNSLLALRLMPFPFGI